MRLAKQQPQDDDGLPGQDSFLDIVANIVGILIILVMVVGVRVSHSALAAEKSEGDETKTTDLVTSEETEADGKAQKESGLSVSEAQRIEALQSEIETATKQIRQTEDEVGKMAVRVASLTQETMLQDRKRQELLMHEAVIEKGLERRRDLLSEEKQQEYDVQKQITEAHLQLDQLTRELLTLETAPEEAEKVENVPTPLAKTVTGKEIHLRLKGGLVSIVPVEPLMAEIDARIGALRGALQSRGEVIETYGPINGYRLRLMLAKRAVEMPPGAPRHMQQYDLEQSVKFLPTSDELGEIVEQALLPGSELMKHLRDQRREATPVTIWVYTDSFDEFRSLKRALWEMGFPVAVRPMRPGAQIGASPHGTNSAAQQAQYMARNPFVPI